MDKPLIPFSVVELKPGVPTLVFFDPVRVDCDLLPKIESVFYVPAFGLNASVGIDVVEEVEAWLAQAKEKALVDA